MMTQAILIRTATAEDTAAVDTLLARSYPKLLAADYPPSTLVMTLPIISRARPELLTSGRYYLALDQGRVVGVGGYSLDAPGARGTTGGVAQRGTAHIRHVATDPGSTRRGVGRALMLRIFADAACENIERFDCLSTRTAVPFYGAMGFRVVNDVNVPLAAGVVFPAVRMVRP